MRRLRPGDQRNLGLCGWWMTEPELESGAVSVPCGPNPCMATANRRQTTHLGGSGIGRHLPRTELEKAGCPSHSSKASVFSNLLLSDSRSHTPQGGCMSGQPLAWRSQLSVALQTPLTAAALGAQPDSGEKNGDEQASLAITWPHSAGGLKVSGGRMWTCWNLTSAESQTQQFCTAGLESVLSREWASGQDAKQRSPESSKPRAEAASAQTGNGSGKCSFSDNVPHGSAQKHPTTPVPWGQERATRPSTGGAGKRRSGRCGLSAFLGVKRRTDSLRRGHHTFLRLCSCP